MPNAVFHFDPQTGEYLSASIATESPLEPGRYLLPAHATFDSPPACGKREVAVRMGDAWERRADWRGVKLYAIADGSDVAIGALGRTPADAGATELPRPDEAHVWKNGKWGADARRRAEIKAQHQAAAWEAIKAERDRRRQSGGYRVGDKWYHSDPASRNQQIALAMLDVPDGLQWKTMDGSFVTMTRALAQQILAAASASDQAVFATAEKHKAAMLSCDDPSSYDFSAGWPPCYGEWREP